LAADIEYPCVVKPLSMSGSRGVIRANDVAEFVQAFIRTRSIVLSETQDPATAQILIEQYRPGFEVALDGILTDGNLRVLVLFDKPDPLEGPFFEETIYTTPSRLPAEVQARIAAETERAARALGLTTGPIHAELRVHNGQPWVVEIAGRSIGGLCSTVLELGSNLALEDVILRHAVGLPYEDLLQPASPAGVMMIPIPARGILKTVHGVEEARAVPGVQGVEITAKVNYPLVPLPEGASYLGFIFAKGTDAADAERALREAHGRLRFEIRPELPLVNAGFRPRLEN
jgi:biotin carboxylase